VARFRTRSAAQTGEGRFIASRITDARRRGATNADIARAFGINERTVRKIIAGETSGTATFERIAGKPRKAAETAVERGGNPSIVRVDIKLGVDSDGKDIVRTVNARVPTVRTLSGRMVTPTPADVFRIPKLAALISAEIERLERQYGAVIVAGRGQVLSMRPIVLRRAPLRIQVTGYTTGAPSV
jgi:hypothetical protein